MIHQVYHKIKKIASPVRNKLLNGASQRGERFLFAFIVALLVLLLIGIAWLILAGSTKPPIIFSR